MVFINFYQKFINNYNKFLVYYFEEVRIGQFVFLSNFSFVRIFIWQFNVSYVDIILKFCKKV